MISKIFFKKIWEGVVDEDGAGLAMDLMVIEADYGYMGIQHVILSTPVYIQTPYNKKFKKSSLTRE